MPPPSPISSVRTEGTSQEPPTRVLSRGNAVGGSLSYHRFGGSEGALKEFFELLRPALRCYEAFVPWQNIIRGVLGEVVYRQRVRLRPMGGAYNPRAQVSSRVARR